MLRSPIRILHASLVQIDTELAEKYGKQQPAVCGKFAFERYAAGYVSALMGLMTLTFDLLTLKLRHVALSCGPVRALLRTHGLESTLMQRCAHGSAPVGALPWAQPTLCAAHVVRP